MLDNKSIFALYSVTLLSVLAVGTASRLNLDSYPAPENGTCYKRVPYDEAVIANLSQGLIKTESTTPPPGIQTWITIIDCCDGYRRDEYTENCEFYCEEGCYGGNCTGPNECTCEDGWLADHGECKPVCRQRCPPNAYCFSPNICACRFGFEEIDGVCQPICQHSCRNGDCIAPLDCRCHRGYFLNETKHCEPICESGCQHGICTAPGVCSCDQGYVNQLYDSESCVPECPPECINGECVTPNVCTCKIGYQQNDNGTCEAQCEENCPENGLCIAPNQCACNTGYLLDNQKKCIKLPPNYNQGSLNPGQQPHGVNHAYNPQRNRPYGNNGRTHGTQRPNYGRPNNSNGQSGVYQTDRPYSYDQTESPIGVIGLPGQVTTQNPQEGFYGIYGDNQPRPQRPYTTPGSYETSTHHPGTKGGIGGSTTHRTPVSDSRYPTVGPFAPLEPYPTQVPNQGPDGRTHAERPHYNYGNGGNRPINGSLHGPFAPGTYNTTQSPIHPDQPRPTEGPYGPYDSQTQSPWNPNRNPLYQNRPNRPYSPYFPNNPHNQEGVNTGHGRPPYEPEIPYNPHRPYNPYAPTNPHGTQGVKTSYGVPPYGWQGTGQTYNPHAPNSPFNPRPSQDGSVKTAQRPPNDIYSRSSVMQSNPQSGIGFSYGIDHLNRVPSYSVPDPYARPESSSVGGIIIVDRHQTPSISQLQPICNGPCINSHCIGLNLCMCEIGFIPDPRNPLGNACVPI